jgi:hypothetical protein
LVLEKSLPLSAALQTSEEIAAALEPVPVRAARRLGGEEMTG